jgi:hypothetical protein
VRGIVAGGKLREISSEHNFATAQPSTLRLMHGLGANEPAAVLTAFLTVDPVEQYASFVDRRSIPPSVHRLLVISLVGPRVKLGDIEAQFTWPTRVSPARLERAASIANSASLDRLFDREWVNCS